MGDALRIDANGEDAIQLDVREALAAAISRADKVAPSNSVVELLTAEEWQTLDASEDNILVQGDDD